MARPLRLGRLRPALTIAGLLGLVACDADVAPPPMVFPVVVEMVDARGAALEGARVEIAGLPVKGLSGPEGNWSFSVRGVPGEQVPVKIEAPRRYTLRGPAERPVELRVDTAAGGKPLTSKVRFTADSTARDALLLLTLDCKPLTETLNDPECGRVRVRTDDAELGTIGPDGLFVRTITTWMGERLRVQLVPPEGAGFRFQPDHIEFTPQTEGEVLLATRTPILNDAPAAEPPPAAPETAPPPPDPPKPAVVAAREPADWPAAEAPAPAPRVAQPPKAQRREPSTSIWDTPPERPARAERPAPREVTREVSSPRATPRPDPLFEEPERPTPPAGGDPEQAEYAACLRKMTQQRGLSGDCAGRFEAVAPSDPRYVVAREALFNDAKGRRDWGQARAFADDLLRLNEGDPEWHYWRGYVEMKRARYRESAASLAAAHQRQNTWPADRRGSRTLQALRNLGVVYTQLALKSRTPEPEDRDRALTYWQMAKELARQLNVADVQRDADREMARLRSAR